jgi:hypothetical protein
MCIYIILVGKHERRDNSEDVELDGKIKLYVSWGNASYPMGTGAIFLGVKRPGREADHSAPSSAEVKNAWSYTSTPQYVFMAWCLVKHRDNFTLPLS